MQYESIFSQHGFELSDLELGQFGQFLTHFMDYNSHTNLSAIRDDAGIVEKHFVDSLYGATLIQSEMCRHHAKSSDPDREKSGTWIASYPRNDDIDNLKSPRLLDIGSGWGFPGIPLKMVIPELQVTLLDSVGKKVKAMHHFVQELGLTNITVIQERAEILAKKPEHAGQYDFVVSRATAYMSDILTWATPFLKQSGRIILYKMPSEDEKKEITRISKKLKLVLQWELEYSLDGKDRILYVFSRTTEKKAV